MRLRAAVNNQLLNVTNLPVVRRGAETLLRVLNNHMHVYLFIRDSCSVFPI